MGIPPTRPAKAADVRKPGQLPFTTKQMAIAGGAVVVLIIIIALVASGGSKKSGSTAKGSGGKGLVIPQNPVADDVAPIIERANKAIAADDPQEAVDILSDARKSNPDNPQLALALGRAYFAKLWWSEGVKNFRDAVRLDPELKSDPEMLKAVLKGFLTTPDVDDRIADFMLEIGDPMKAYLQETADKHPNKQLRARAKAELRRYR
jgi:tetratricopeptide (TPR) repeat protein